MTRALAEVADVAVITASTADNRDRWKTLPVSHLEVDTFSSVATMLASFFDIGRFRRIAEFARGFDPDVVYYPGGHAYKPVIDRMLSGTPVVLTVHDPELHAGEDSPAQRLFARANLAGTEGYVLLNEAQQPAFIARRRVAPERAAVIPLGIFDDGVGTGTALSQVAGAEAVAAPGTRYALFLGRIERYKGIATMLEAFRAVDATDRIPLVVAGAGAFSDEETALLDRIGPGQVVVLNRWLSDREVATLVNGAWVLLVPYVQATQSAVVPLAFAHGVPVIVSDAGGLPEQVDGGAKGSIVPAGDVAALAAAMSTSFRQDRAEHGALGADARDYATTHWAWASLAARLERFLRAISERRAR
jgi:glycosyltransferase involved in cell wall biosynthesis